MSWQAVPSTALMMRVSLAVRFAGTSCSAWLMSDYPAAPFSPPVIHNQIAWNDPSWAFRRNDIHSA